jgi:hypothetical protein
VSDWEGQLVLQDALRTRFIENWCKVVRTVEFSKPLLRQGSWVFPLVRGLWRNRLLIRRLHVQVVPGCRDSPYVPRVAVRNGKSTTSPRQRSGRELVAEGGSRLSMTIFPRSGWKLIPESAPLDFSAPAHVRYTNDDPAGA